MGRPMSSWMRILESNSAIFIQLLISLGVASVVACSGSSFSSPGATGDDDSGTNDGGTNTKGDGGASDGGTVTPRWNAITPPASVGKILAIAARGSSVWVASFPGAHLSIQKIQSDGTFHEIWPLAGHPCPPEFVGQPCEGMFDSGPLLYAASSTSLIVAGEAATGVYVDGQPPRFLGPKSDVQNHDPISIAAANADDVWMGTVDSIWDVFDDGNTTFCPGIPTYAVCANGGFANGIFDDGQTLWVTYFGGADGQGANGVWATKPSGHLATQTDLTTTLGIAGDFTFIAAGAGSTAWAVGDLGAAAHFDGTTWAASPTGTKMRLQSASVIANGEAWAVGTDGIVHYDGSAWSVPSESGIPANGESVAATDDGTVYVLSEDGDLVRRNP